MNGFVNKGKYRIRLAGPFDIADPSGTSIRPHQVKQTALLALLASAPGMSRGRRWCQALLWPDSAPEQAAANLRQTLARLRRHLGDARALLGSDKQNIWLDRDRVELCPAPVGQDLLEGLDVGEEAFEDWLREQRATSLQGPLPHRDTPVRISMTGVPHTPEQMLLMHSVQAFLLSLKQFDLRDAPSASAVRGGFVLQLRQIGGDTVSLSIRDATLNRQLWMSLARQDSEREMVRLATCACEALVDFAARAQDAGTSALTSVSSILDGLFIPGTMRPAEMMAEVNDLISARSDGMLFGLRNCIRMLQFGERMTGFDRIDQEIVEEDLRRSVEMQPHNPLVQCLASHAWALFLNEPGMAIDAAQQSARNLPLLPLPRAFLALAYLRAGRPEEGLAASAQAMQIGAHGRYSAFLATVHAAALACSGRFEACASHSANALRLNPRFGATRQYLFLAQERMGRLADAEVLAREIQLTDTRFDSEQLASPYSSVNIAMARNLMADSAQRLGF